MVWIASQPYTRVRGALHDQGNGVGSRASATSRATTEGDVA
jgi:hypothetical protein